MGGMAGGGRVSVVTRGSTAAEEVHPGVIVEVQDTGAGIPPELLPRIFELFVTTKGPGKGTGLGLAVCQEIVRGHGGRIEVSSRVGEGTCVQILLPTEERGNYSGAAAATG
jgi:signal transduction histidine kinase